MLLNGTPFLTQIKKGSPVVSFLGENGSYKTCLAVEVARYLISTGEYRAVYANLPIRFAVSPPYVINIGSDFPLSEMKDLQKARIRVNGENYQLEMPTGNLFNIEVSVHESYEIPDGQRLTPSLLYSMGEGGIRIIDVGAKIYRHSIFILDEAWLMLADYSKHASRYIFAMARKRKQRFLLCSAVPLESSTTYAKYTTSIRYNLMRMGLMCTWHQAWRAAGVERGKKTATNFLFVMPQTVFGLYSTDYEPDDCFPIMQADRGIAYDTESRPIPPHLVNCFDINSRGLGELKSEIPEKYREEIDRLYPVFNFDLSKLKPVRSSQKRKFSIRVLLGGDFDPALLMTTLLGLWIAAALTFWPVGAMLHDQKPRLPKNIKELTAALLFVSQKNWEIPAPPPPTELPDINLQPVEWREQQ